MQNCLMEVLKLSKVLKIVASAVIAVVAIIVVVLIEVAFGLACEFLAKNVVVSPKMADVLGDGALISSFFVLTALTYATFFS